MQTTVIGAILAGGQSSRMGADKAGLAVAGGTLLDWMQDKLHRAGIDTLVVCGAPHGLADLIPHRGPLSALHSLGHHYPGARVLVVPVDMPLIHEQTLRVLIEAGANAEHPLHYEGFIFPLLLTLAPAISKLLDDTLGAAIADYSMAALLRAAGAQRLARPVNAAEFVNLNTPAEWRDFLASQQMATATHHDPHHQS
jgi:molybdopterin-guanine dinucleotide biosynthesis protein A